MPHVYAAERVYTVFSRECETQARCGCTYPVHVGTYHLRGKVSM